jgi:short-subunit dehydrogenase
MQAIKGANILLTGASRGIGVFIGRRLAERGGNLVLVARSEALLAERVAELSRFGGLVKPIVADLRDPGELRELPKRVEDAIGPLDILINNAGIDPMGPFVDTAEDDLREIIAVKLLAPLILTKAVLPGMIARGHGQVVSMSSMSGKKGIAYEATYTAANAGLVEWTNSLRVELEGTGVGISVICPGFVREVGLFAVHGVPAPRLAGSSSADQVAKAVVKAIDGNRQEVIVQPTPTRPLLALNAISPSLGNKIIAAMGVTALQKRLAGK